MKIALERGGNMEKQSLEQSKMILLDPGINIIARRTLEATSSFNKVLNCEQQKR